LNLERSYSRIDTSIDKRGPHCSQLEEHAMISWGVTFFAIAIAAALLGFGGISGTASSAALLMLVVGAVAALMLQLADGEPSGN